MNNNTTTAAPNNDGGPQQGVSPILVQTKEDATHQQVGVVLGIIHTMRGVLMADPREVDAPQPLEGEIGVAATKTMIGACARLDAILEDGDRWTIGQHNQLHAAIIKVHEAQLKTIRMQQENLELMRRPSTQLRPRVIMFGDGYLAFWGNVTQPGMAIYGKGATPHDALTDFDAAFHRTAPENVRRISAMLDNKPDMTQGVETPEEFHKKNKQNPSDEQPQQPT